MKKNISINISGIIFHIEEDGYENLKNYLESINTYFSSYEESEEIIADIESRIAEIFLQKLSDGQQVVSAEDVSNLIKTMGNTADFEAMEEEDDLAPASEPTPETKKEKEPSSGRTNTGSSAGSQQQQSRQTYKSRTLQRDLNNQTLGGVASGLAHYFNVDAIWIRIAFIAFLPVGIITYFILWIVIPGSSSLEENSHIKKLYRNPDDRVLGGVCSGIATFLKIDTIIVRIIFIVLFFGGGVGLVAYFVFWAITPEANSITDRMQMKGEKVTLSNIDENIKKQKSDEQFGPKNEGAFTKVLLFPFRLIGSIFSGLSKAFAPLMLFIVAVIRIFTGGIISIVGLSMMLAALAVAGVMLGIYNNDFFYINDGWNFIPYEVVEATFPLAGVIAILIVFFIPCFYILTAGLTVIAKRKVMSTSVGWSILGVWLIAILVAFATVPNVFRDFRDESEISRTETINASGAVLQFTLDDYNEYNRQGGNFYGIDLDIRQSKDNLLTLKSDILSRGRNARDAKENADMIEYTLSVKDSVVIFPDIYEFKRDGKFRFQELELTLYVPEGQPFKVGRDMEELVDYFDRDYRWSEVYRNTWVFKGGDLECLTCESR